MTDFDVIVVGAGGAGGPLAARLSEDPHRRVLLIEAGIAPESEAEVPTDLLNPGLMTGYLPTHEQNWAHSVSLTADKKQKLSRGKVLGGSTSLNGTYFIRARKRDFDQWSANGNDEWTYEKSLPFYIKSETDLTFGEREGHSGEGPVPVSRPHEADLSEYSKAFIAAAKAAGIPWVEDLNADGPLGVGLMPSNSRDGVRMSTGLTYVNPARERDNLTVWGSTLARRVIFDGSAASGVEVGRHDGEIHIVTAPEIVLSGGTIKSPHLLALSGIGPTAELNAAGIDVVVDLPGVGKQFSDHPSVPITWTPKRRIDIDDARYAMQSLLHINSSVSDSDGDIEILPIERSLMSLIGFPRTEDNSLPINVSIQTASRGNITTLSSDPEVEPLVEYNYLTSEQDLIRMREGVRFAVALLRSEQFADIFDDFTNLTDEILHDADRFNAWLEEILDTALHGCGSCRMGPNPEEGDVVDQYGRVHGVTGLRVADTSILPTVPSRGPSATSTMIGERIAAFIAEQVPVSESAAKETVA